MSKIYRVRYRQELWNKPAGSSQSVRPGIRVSEDDYGYADDIFLGSILRDDDGKIVSILLLSTEGNVEGKPSKEMLIAIRGMIDHQLEHHT